MTATRTSKKFNPNTLTEKVVPALLALLVVILVAVFVIIGLSLAGVISPA